MLREKRKEARKKDTTARKPIAEAVDLAGIQDDADKDLTAKLIKWWKEENLQNKLRIEVLIDLPTLSIGSILQK